MSTIMRKQIVVKPADDVRNDDERGCWCWLHVAMGVKLDKKSIRKVVKPQNAEQIRLCEKRGGHGLWCRHRAATFLQQEKIQASFWTLFVMRRRRGGWRAVEVGLPNSAHKGAEDLGWIKAMGGECVDCVQNVPSCYRTPRWGRCMPMRERNNVARTLANVMRFRHAMSDPKFVLHRAYSGYLGNHQWRRWTDFFRSCRYKCIARTGRGVLLSQIQKRYYPCKRDSLRSTWSVCVNIDIGLCRSVDLDTELSLDFLVLMSGRMFMTETSLQHVSAADEIRSDVTVCCNLDWHCLFSISFLLIVLIHLFCFQKLFPRQIEYSPVDTFFISVSKCDFSDVNRKFEFIFYHILSHSWVF